MNLLRTFSGSIPFAVLALASVATAQSSDQSWSASSQQGSVAGATNPTRTSKSHSESDGRVIDKTSVEALGPDGRYVPYSETEKESVRVNDSTTRTMERTYGRDADGRRVLVQQQQQESRSLPDGDQTVTRIFSSPDSNGGMQIMRRESEHTKQISPGVQVTNTTVLTPDVNGALAASVRTEQRDTRATDGTVESRKTTLLPDGNGGWRLSEVRESTTKQEGADLRSKDERVLRPDADGKMSVVQRTVNRQAQSAGEKRETTDTYSTDVPGVAGDSSLQLVERATTIRRADSSGGQTTTRQIEQPRPGSPGGELHVTERAIDVIRPGTSGAASETQTILTSDSDGHLGQVSVDMGKTSDPSSVQVDIAPAAKKK